MSFRFACELLQKDLGLVLEAGTKATKQNTTTKLPPPLAADADSQTALKQVIDYYHETLKQSPEALEYLGSRGLSHPELIDRFKLGFANRTLGYRLPEKNRKAGAEMRGKLQSIGILRDSGHEHFNGSLVVPVIDGNGIISEVYGRKILAISEEEGAENASYALKLLQSEGEVSIASTGKDPTTGNLTTQEYRVEGPVMLFLTTTAIDIDEELLNRCVVLTVNETREQTAAIHAMQRSRQTLEGLLLDADKDDIVSLHRNAQHLLRPLLVANPYANELTFLDDKTRTRRDHMKYLTLIRSIALLHQYQRPIKTMNHKGKHLSYVEVTLSDIETANRLASEVLGRTLDELPPQSRKLLQLIADWVKTQSEQQQIDVKDYRFSRKDIREMSGWGNTQLKVHLRRLEDMEYLLVHRGGRGQSFVYELLYAGQGTAGDAFLMGLIDTSELENRACDEKRSGDKSEKAASGRGKVGAVSGGGQTPQSVTSIDANALVQANQPTRTSTTIETSASHRTHPLAAAGSEV